MLGFQITSRLESINYISYIFFKKKSFFGSKYKKNLQLKKSRSVAKSTNIDDYKSINLITTDKLSSTPRAAFKRKEYIAKLSNRKLKDFVYYNYG